MIAILFEDGLALLEGEELAGLSSSFEFGGIECLFELALVDDLPHDVTFDDVLETASQTSLYILATHRYYHATRLRHQRVSTYPTLH